MPDYIEPGSFNPRPGEGATYPRVAPSGVLYVSIHAPVKGRHSDIDR